MFPLFIMQNKEHLVGWILVNLFLSLLMGLVYHADLHPCSPTCTQEAKRICSSLLPFSYQPLPARFMPQPQAQAQGQAQAQIGACDSIFEPWTQYSSVMMCEGQALGFGQDELWAENNPDSSAPQSPQSPQPHAPAGSIPTSMTGPLLSSPLHNGPSYPELTACPYHLPHTSISTHLETTQQDPNTLLPLCVPFSPLPPTLIPSPHTAVRTKPKRHHQIWSLSLDAWLLLHAQLGHYQLCGPGLLPLMPHCPCLPPSQAPTPIPSITGSHPGWEDPSKAPSNVPSNAIASQPCGLRSAALLQEGWPEPPLRCLTGFSHPTWPLSTS